MKLFLTCRICGKKFMSERTTVPPGMMGVCSPECRSEWMKRRGIQRRVAELRKKYNGKVPEKTCLKCGRVLPADRFRAKSQRRMGLLTICRDCEMDGDAWQICSHPRHPVVTGWVHNYVKTTQKNAYSTRFLYGLFLDEHPGFLDTLKNEGYKDPDAQLKRFVTNALKIYPGMTAQGVHQRTFYYSPPQESVTA